MKTILLVDDSEVVRMVTRLRLESIGYEVIETGDGQEALDFLANNDKEIVLIITDMQMPRMDGREFIRNLRNQESYRYVPVIALSTSELETKDLGATACVQKSLDGDKFIHMVKKIIR